jgi:hypothetical protein
MKKLFLITLCLPLFVWGQFSIGNNQTICSGDTAQIIATLSGPGTTGCSGVTDSLTCPNLGGNGSSGNSFNIINTSGGNLNITGFSQGGTNTTIGVDMKVWMYPGDYLLALNDTNSWVLVGSALVNLTSGAASGYVAVSGVVIPAGATYGFRIGAMASSIAYTNGVGTSGVTIWQSNNDLTITEGHGGVFPFWNQNSPRNWNGTIHYGAGASWIDINTGQTIGSGDSLIYSPLQTTDIAAVFDCNGQTYSDTMHLEVLNTNISTTGLSLCNGPLVLTAQTGFYTYNWSGGSSTTAVLTVNSTGVYYVDYVTSNGFSCQSDPITIYSGNIPITLSTPDSLFICQGDTVEMNGPLGFSTYNWSTGATTSSITTTLTGNYSLSVVDGNGCPGTSNTTSISISPQTIIANTTSSSLCNGPVTLDAGSGFAIYQWYNNNVLITGGISQNLIATTAGAYHCEIVYPTGCTAISNTLSIVAGTGAFNVIISAIGADSLCKPNGQVILDAGNYASFIWSTNETTQQISVNTLGSYSVDVVDAGGCQGSSNISFEVFDAVNTSVISGPTNPTQFQTVTYSVLSSSGSTYDWTVTGGTIQSGVNTNSIDIMWDNSGTFSLTVIETDINGCVGEEITIIVSIIISSIEEVNNTKILKKITDVLGKETKKEHNTPLFYIYDDGTVEKKISIE